MKEIRLQRIVDKKTCNKIIGLYKQTNKIDEFMTDKYFYQDLVSTTLEKVLRPLIDSLKEILDDSIG